MTYYQKVVDFNTLFGVKLHSTPQPEIFDSDMTTINNGMKLVREEMSELESAIKEKDYVETADAIADSIYVLLGLAGRMGINMDTVFNMVHVNNMTKICQTEKEAQETVDYYNTNPQLGYVTPAYRRAEDNIHWVVYNQSTGKILKSCVWRPVDLTFLLNNK